MIIVAKKGSRNIQLSKIGGKSSEGSIEKQIKRYNGGNISMRYEEHHVEIEREKYLAEALCESINLELQQLLMNR
jgi:hypothetical protein